jgi:hypothetical protein
MKTCVRMGSAESVGAFMLMTEGQETIKNESSGQMKTCTRMGRSAESVGAFMLVTERQELRGNFRRPISPSYPLPYTWEQRSGTPAGRGECARSPCLAAGYGERRERGWQWACGLPSRGRTRGAFNHGGGQAAVVSSTKQQFL